MSFITCSVRADVLGEHEYVDDTNNLNFLLCFMADLSNGSLLSCHGDQPLSLHMKGR